MHNVILFTFRVAVIAVAFCIAVIAVPSNKPHAEPKKKSKMKIRKKIIQLARWYIGCCCETVPYTLCTPANEP